jgi:NAD(P)-dependent dehydrogenase (short-subunit alcohol dehydrogenase family)
MTIECTGFGTTIAKELRKLLPDGEGMIGFGDCTADRYLFAAGVLHNSNMTQQTETEIATSLGVNMISVIVNCELILRRNPAARICVIGSKAGEAGSFDQTYAAAKAGVHNYVRSARITEEQQIVCIAPTIIMDSGMTKRRNEEGRRSLLERMAEHPKKRYLKAVEVARLVHYLLYVDEGYITNTVIEIKGGPGWW